MQQRCTFGIVFGWIRSSVSMLGLRKKSPNSCLTDGSTEGREISSRELFILPNTSIFITPYISLFPTWSYKEYERKRVPKIVMKKAWWCGNPLFTFRQDQTNAKDTKLWNCRAGCRTKVVSTTVVTESCSYRICKLRLFEND